MVKRGQLITFSAISRSRFVTLEWEWVTDDDDDDDDDDEEQEAQLMLTTGSTRLAVNQGQQT